MKKAAINTLSKAKTLPVLCLIMLILTAPTSAQYFDHEDSSTSGSEIFFYDYSEVADEHDDYDQRPGTSLDTHSDLIIITPDQHDQSQHSVPIFQPARPETVIPQRPQTITPRPTREAVPPGIPSYPNRAAPSIPPARSVPYVPPVLTGAEGENIHKQQRVREPQPEADREKFHKPEAAGIGREKFHNAASADIGREKFHNAESTDIGRDNFHKTNSSVMAGDSFHKTDPSIPDRAVVLDKVIAPDNALAPDRSISPDNAVAPDRAAPDRAMAPDNVAADSVVVKKIAGREFAPIAKARPNSDGKTMHFYSDPMPLVAAPPPDPDFDPDFADFEAARAIPVIDAPFGLYDFSFTGSGIQIAASHTFDGVEIKAGQVVALNMITTNNSNSGRQFNEKIIAPAGVQGVHEISDFAVGFQKSISRRIALHLDQTLSAGTYKVTYEVRCLKAPGISGKLDFSFAIRAQPQLAFELMPTESPIKESLPFKATGKLVNSGNTSLNVHLQVKGRADRLAVSPLRISLPAGGHAMVELSGVAPAKANPLDDILQLNFSATSDKKSGGLQLLDTPLRLRISQAN